MASFLVGCGSYVVLNVQDPQLLATGAAVLSVGSEPERMQRIALEGHSFPLSVTVTATLGGERQIQVDAMSADGVVLGRAVIEAELSGRNLPVVVELAPPCDGDDFSGRDDEVDARCDDGVYCDGNERCVSRTCRAGPIPCPPSPFACADVLCLEPQRQCGVNVFHDRCQEDLLCDPGAGCKQGARCADDSSCQDDFSCNGAEVCNDGTCQRGQSPTSDDENPCTAGACTEELGVVQVPMNDGGACPLPDGEAGVCQRGVCAEADTRLRCARDGDCDDGLACNGVELCIEGNCFTGVPIVVDDGNSCTADACTEQAGVTHVERANGSTCALPLAPGGVGRCIDGLCGFPHLFACEEDDGCAQPTDSCEGDVAVQYSGAGSCDGDTGTCDYSGVTTATDCSQSGQVCRDGACVEPCCVSGRIVEVELPPTATYLRLAQDPQAIDARPVVLADVGFCAGDLLRFSERGQIFVDTGDVNTTDLCGGVFSASSTLLASNITERVPDAIDAGEDIFTNTTSIEDQATDIAEDFNLESRDVVVPAGATHLFVAMHDRFYSDNGATEEGMFIVIECLDP